MRTYLFRWLWFAILCLQLWRGIAATEGFRERLVLRPLPDGTLLAHFRFVSSLARRSEHQHHHKLFPKAIVQIVESFRVQEMELSFTQGRWKHKQWGAYEGVKPSGVELRAEFRRSPDIDMLWRNLTHALSGLFCASINFLEDPAMVGSHGDEVRLGALPREAVCTENLTPWLKLLPCRDQSGLSALLERPKIYNGQYHSLRVHVVNQDFDSLTLTQTLTVVLKPSSSNWSLSSLFGRSVSRSCPLATSSHVQIELDERLKVDDVNSNDIFELQLPPETVTKRKSSLCLHYDVNKRAPLDVGMEWRAFSTWSPYQGPFRATQFLTGRGNGRGAIVSVVNGNMKSAGDVEVTMFQIVPWYVRLYMHTLKVTVDGKHVNPRLKLSPADDRNSPAVMEIGVTIAGNASVVLISVDFDKGYLRIHEHPPDANRGFDLPSARFTFSRPGFSSQIYTDNLLVLLATPDFSMPYNVITFVMTALALYFGSLLNALRLRSGGSEVPQPASRIALKVQKLVARFTGRTTKVKTQ
jgi:phosphatidylinositol glycan class T